MYVCISGCVCTCMFVWLHVEMNVCSKYERFMTNTGSQVKYSVAMTTIVVRAKSTLHLSLEMSKTLTMSGTYKKKCVPAKGFFCLKTCPLGFSHRLWYLKLRWGLWSLMYTEHWNSTTRSSSPLYKVKIRLYICERDVSVLGLVGGSFLTQVSFSTNKSLATK